MRAPAAPIILRQAGLERRLTILVRQLDAPLTIGVCLRQIIQPGRDRGQIRR